MIKNIQKVPPYIQHPSHRATVLCRTIQMRAPITIGPRHAPAQPHAIVATALPACESAPHPQL